ncbi:MAG TPA: class I SAM-dependent methyltransferase [Jatrophihabitantaceae bacterium]|nr:class I SAM-dependent methyltransferase [Jatrophihabitantaceae bacterium]
MSSSGSGPGVITPDGCAVDVYARLPATGEPEIVASAVPSGASILELGSGAGRVTHALVALGYSVVAVDESPEMLALVRGADTVQSTIAELELGRTFDAVLFGSHLVNVPDADERAALLAAARRHVAADGVVLIEWHAPQWFDAVTEGAGGTVGDVRIEIGDISRDGDLLSATVRYWSESELWTQSFTARRLSEERLRSDLEGAGLEFDRWLTDDKAWLTARAG